MTQATTTSDRDLLRKVEWLGMPIGVHRFFEYAIVVYLDWEGFRHYKPFINEHDISKSYSTPEEAIAGAIAYKYEGCNHKADKYFIKAIK